MIDWPNITDTKLISVAGTQGMQPHACNSTPAAVIGSNQAKTAAGRGCIHTQCRGPTSHWLAASAATPIIDQNPPPATAHNTCGVRSRTGRRGTEAASKPPRTGRQHAAGTRAPKQGHAGTRPGVGFTPETSKPPTLWPGRRDSRKKERHGKSTLAPADRGAATASAQTKRTQAGADAPQRQQSSTHTCIAANEWRPESRRY